MVRPPMRPAMGMVLWKDSWLAEDSSLVHCFFFFFFSKLLVREDDDE